MSHKATNSVSRGGGFVGKFFGSIFFLIFLLAGSYFTYLVIQGFLFAVETRSWNQVPAQIESVQIVRNQKHDEDNSPYELSISYSYTVGSQTYQKKLAAEDHRFSMYEDAHEVASLYPQGTTQTCYVNPEDPSEALLFLSSLWNGLFIFIPLLFVAIGGGGIYGLWFGGLGQRSKVGPRSIAKTKISQTSGNWVLWVVGAVFSLLGLVGTIFFGRWGYNAIESLSWVETPAHVIESSVIRHRSDNDDGVSYTYSIDMFYEYEFEGKTYRASRYENVGGATSGYESKKSVVDAHPPGSEIQVFVNPSNPNEAVVNKGFSWLLLLVLFPLVFLLIGLGILYSRFGSRSASEPGDPNFADQRTKSRQGFAERGVAPEGPVVLKPGASPLGKIIGIIFVCLFWNGIVSVFVYQAFASWQAGSPDWFLSLFITPFVLIGLLLVFGVFYSILAFFNPRVELTVNTQSPALGSELEISWQTKGNSARMKELRLSLEAIEEVRYRRGTNTSTDRHTFYEHEITKVNQSMMIQRGSARFEIPRDKMHSFSQHNNKIIWKLHLRGDVPRWPDVTETYELNVQPVRAS